MGSTFTAKTKPKSSNSNSTSTSSSGNWGMGLLLVFFPEDEHNNGSNCNTKNTCNIVDKTNNLLMPSSTRSSSSIKRTNSNILFTKAQSTISICALLVLITLLLFTLSTFEPSTTSIHTPRRFLSHNHKPNPRHFSLFNYLLKKMTPYLNQPSKSTSSFALQGMGTLYRRGTMAMSDLVVAHLTEDVKEDEFRLFLRLLHRSGITAKSDVAFLFGTSSKFDSLIRYENDSFLKLVQRYRDLNNTKSNSVLGFDVTHFVKNSKEVGEPLWGKKTRGNYSSSPTVPEGTDNVESGELTGVSYGSIVGFEVSELDPENSLGGFLDHVPTSLRRWACYPMLLGRVRHNFKHIALVDTKHLLLLSDPLGRVRSNSPESVHISLKSSDKHGKRNSHKTQSHHSVNSAIITGGVRGVRRLSSAMLTEIVRAAMQHKKKNSVTESGVLSQLVRNEHVLKNINLITSTESILDASSLTGLSSKAAANCGFIQRGGNSNSNSNSNSNHDVDYSIIMKIICSCEVDSSVYKNC